MTEAAAGERPQKSSRHGSGMTAREKLVAVIRESAGDGDGEPLAVEACREGGGSEGASGSRGKSKKRKEHKSKHKSHSKKKHKEKRHKHDN
jgi:hypothetical protein